MANCLRSPPTEISAAVKTCKRLTKIYCNRCSLNIHHVISQCLKDFYLLLLHHILFTCSRCNYWINCKVDDKKKHVTYLFGIMFYLLQQNLCFIDLYPRWFIIFFFLSFRFLSAPDEKWELFYFIIAEGSEIDLSCLVSNCVLLCYQSIWVENNFSLFVHSSRAFRRRNISRRQKTWPSLLANFSIKLDDEIQMEFVCRLRQNLLNIVNIFLLDFRC